MEFYTCVQAFILTLGLTLSAASLGLLLAIVGCFLSFLFPFFRPILQLGSGFVRGTPLLLQLFFLYFGLSPLLPKYALCQWLTTPFMIALLTLSLNSAAYTYHALWGTFTQLPHHQIKAGEVLGFSPSNLFWKILLPQGLWQFWPLYRFEAIFILKSTALVSSITLLDITGLAKLWLSQTYQPLPTFTFVVLIYWCLAMLLQTILKTMEKKYIQPQNKIY